MSGHAEGHEAGGAAKAWLDWFETAGVLPEAVQAHKEHEATAQGGQAPGGAGGDLDAARKLLASLAVDWHRTEEHVRAGMQKLKAELDKFYDGDPAAGQMEKDFQVHVDAIFSKFDGTLAKDVQAAASAGTEAELGAIKAHLKRTVSDFVAFLEHDSIALMDDNPFVDVKIVPICEAALQSMLASLG